MTEQSHPSRLKDAAALFGFILLCFGAAAIGGLATSSSVDGWYQTVNKPSFNPPDWVFAPVWTTLYLFMAIAGWRAWRSPAARSRSVALILFGIQLVLNVLWSVLFFGLQRIDLAALEIVFLLLAIAATTLFLWRVDKLSGLLFVPYLAWVGFAAFLNVTLLSLN